MNTYIVNGVRSAKGKFNIGYFELLNIVELTAYHKPGREIERLTEIKTAYPLHSIRQDIHKSTMCMFLVEILNKCIIERHKNEQLFEFLFSAILTLERVPRNNSFHLQFILKLTSFLGFGIQSAETVIEQSNNSAYYNEKLNVELLQSLIDNDLSTELNISQDQRQTILNDILYYYQIHLDISKLKSLEVLQTIFR